MLLIAIIVSLIFSAFFSGLEMAFVSANKLEIELHKDKFNRLGAIITSFYDDSDRFLTTMLIGNNIALVAFTYFTTKILEPVLFPSLSGSILQLVTITLLITLIVLLVGEFLPKLFCGLYAQKVLFLFAYPLLLFKLLLAIPTKITTSFSKNFINYFSHNDSSQQVAELSKTDLEHYIDDALDENDEEIDKSLFTKALRLDKVKVKDCMVPRTEIVFVDQNEPINELISAFQKFRHSRIIIVNGDIENVKGYIHHQQVLTLPESVQDLILPIEFVPEAMNIRDLMSKFSKDEINITCVVDEFGSISGLITMEDILEEIFGEIEDEHDLDSFTDIRISSSEFIFSGRSEVEHINAKYGTLNIPKGDYHTLSGFILSISGKIPEKGETISYENLELSAEAVSDNRIELIRVKIEDKKLN